MQQQVAAQAPAKGTCGQGHVTTFGMCCHQPTPQSIRRQACNQPQLCASHPHTQQKLPKCALNQTSFCHRRGIAIGGNPFNQRPNPHLTCVWPAPHKRTSMCATATSAFQHVPALQHRTTPVPSIESCNALTQTSQNRCQCGTFVTRTAPVGAESLARSQAGPHCTKALPQGNFVMGLQSLQTTATPSSATLAPLMGATVCRRNACNMCT
jgi:hypothetical protein